MTDNELLAKIDSENAEKIFSDLYGENGVEAARQRYKKLIMELLNQDSGSFPDSELQNKSGNLRVFSAPGRTELAGNHTDHNRGKVLAASIQLDSVAVVQARTDNTVFYRSTGFPDVKVKLTDLNPKSDETGTTEALVRGIAAGINSRTSSAENNDGFAVGGFSANADSTVLPGSGLSSSAALEVLLGRIFDSLYRDEKSGFRQPLSAVEIAQIGQTAENVFFGKPCGLMDQIACATGGAVAIDFANTAHPEVKQINFDLAAAGYSLCVVNTGGSHADLTADYASIPAEMKKVAAFFGKQVLGELEKETVLAHAAELRKTFGDRALLRSIHFFDENIRVDNMTAALSQMENAAAAAAKQQVLASYLELVNESGDSSWELLQNIYPPHSPQTQGISTALALTKDFFKKQNFCSTSAKGIAPRAACRVHGGGFAGTIQVYIPFDAIDAYREKIEAVFGAGSVTVLRIRPIGAVELTF